MRSSVSSAQLPQLGKRMFGAAKAGMRALRLRCGMAAGRARRQGRRARGNAAIETAFIAPILLLMLVGIADYGRAIYAEMQVQSAAQAGAQLALESAANGFNATTVTAISGAVTSATTLPGITASPAPIVSCGCASGNSVGNASPAGCPANTTPVTGGCAVNAGCTGSCAVSCTSIQPVPTPPAPPTPALCGSSPNTYAAGLFVTVTAEGNYTTTIPYPGIANSFSLTRYSQVRIQ
jgi:Flp pilus assembly protein TadG